MFVIFLMGKDKVFQADEAAIVNRLSTETNTSHFDLPGFLTAVDFEKAFDSVAHSFVQEVL